MKKMQQKSISMVKNITLFSVLIFFSGTAFSQTVVRGRVLNADTKSPLEYVNVTLKARHSDFVSGGNTNERGGFEVHDVPNDTLLLIASFIGYDTYQDTIFIDNSQKTVDLKPVLLHETAKVLQGVEVAGIRNQMRFELDKKVFDVSSSVIADGASASDILQDIPSVEVSTDGTISLRGSESVTIWLNGKPSGLNSDNQSQILEQLPADAIDRIEIITNPSSKYSPEGTAGIINIVLKESTKPGYYGSVQAGVNYNSRFGGNVSANINYSSKKVEAFGSVGFRSRAMQSGGYAHRKLFDELGDSIGFLNSDNLSQGRGNNLFTRLGVTYHATKKDHLSLSGFGMYGKNFSTTTVDNTSNMLNLPSESQRNTAQNNTMFGTNITLGYKHDFGKNHYLDFTAAYNLWNMSGTSDFNQTNTFFRDIDTIKNSSYQYQTTDAKNQMFDIKLDYSNQITENGKVEAGYQGTFTNSQSPQNTYQDRTMLSPIPDFCNNLLYQQYVNALYALYGGKYKNFNYQVGVRGEMTNTQIRSLAYGETAAETAPFDTTYFSVFPSVFLGYTLPKDNQLQINYTRRITRPRGWRLNPFKNISDSTNIQFGNPYLLPEFANSVELNYIKSWTNHIFSFSGYFRNTDGMMQRISFMDKDTKQMYSTFTNISSNISAGAELVLKDKLFKFLNLTTTVNLFYYYLAGFSYTPDVIQFPNVTTYTGTAESNFSWNFRIIAQAMLPKGFMLQVTGGYNAPQAIAQGTTKGRYFVDAGLRKTIKNFTLNLNARDIFNSRNRSSITYGNGYELDSRNWRGGRNISFTVTYAFGNMKPERKPRPQTQQQGGEDDGSGNGGGSGMGGDF